MIKHVELDRCHSKRWDWTKRTNPSLEQPSLEEPFMTPDVWKLAPCNSQTQGFNFNISAQSRATLQASNFNIWEQSKAVPSRVKFGMNWKVKSWHLENPLSKSVCNVYMYICIYIYYYDIHRVHVSKPETKRWYFFEAGAITRTRKLVWSLCLGLKHESSWSLVVHAAHRFHRFLKLTTWSKTSK